jgi:serine/threonine protein kinase
MTGEKLKVRSGTGIIEKPTACKGNSATQTIQLGKRGDAAKIATLDHAPHGRKQVRSPIMRSLHAMTITDAGTMADAAVRLRILSMDQVREGLEELPSRKAPAADFLRAMERKGMLTSYQIGKLVKGDQDGFVLGGFRILYKIASGSFGRVFRADDPSTGRVVAIKVLRSRWCDDKRRVELFVREAKTGMSLKHPNIVEILAVNHEPQSNQYYIVMEFVEGGDLAEFLKVRKKLQPDEMLRILDDTTAALAHAFSKGYSHRDIKLTNILISSQGTAKLVDFGLAGGNAGSSPKGSEEAAVDRTVDYAGLEKASNVPPGDPRSDIFFVGCVAYELLSGRSPLEKSKARSAQSSTSAIRFQKIVPLSPEEVQAPASVFRLLENMMSVDVEKRIQTPAQLLERIRECRREIEGGYSKAGVAAEAKGQKTIFLVEKDEQLQDVLRAKLKEKGFRMLIAADPARALERFRQQSFDMLIVNASTIGEPGSYAFETIMEEARSQELGCRGILLLSEEQADWQERLAGFPGVATLIQPVKYRQLLQTIKELLYASAE